MFNQKCRNPIRLTIFMLAAAVLFAGCGNSTSDTLGGGKTPGLPTQGGAFVTTTDFSTGSYSGIDPSDLSAYKDLPSTTGIIGSDNSAVAFNGKIYLTNRFGSDNITALDTADLSVALNQFSTGTFSNPQDVAMVSDTKGYVSLLGSNDLLIIDPTDQTTPITGTISLAALLDPADTDGMVEAVSMAIVGNRLFIALQLLDSFAAVRSGVLAVIDITTDSLVDTDPATAGIQGVTLTGQNPTFMKYDANLGKLVVTETGTYFANDGGIETVDATTFTAEGYVITEATLGGDAGDFVILSTRTGYVVTGGFSPNDVSIFDIPSKAKTGTLGLNSPWIPSLALDASNRLFVPDRDTTTPGVRVFETTNNTEITTTAPIDVGLPPNKIVFY